MLMVLFIFVVYQFLFINAQESVSDNALKLSFMAFIWSLLLYSLINTFAGQVVEVQPAQSLFAKLKQKVKNLAMWLLSVLFILLTFAILLLSSRMSHVLS